MYPIISLICSPSVMMSWADGEAIEAFLSLPGPFGAVRITLEPLLTASSSLADFQARLERQASGLGKLTARNVDGFELRPSVSFALIWAAILLPAGFLLGGIVIYDGDPSLGVWLVPVGALLLFYSVARIALDLSKRKL